MGRQGDGLLKHLLLAYELNPAAHARTLAALGVERASVCSAATPCHGRRAARNGSEATVQLQLQRVKIAGKMAYGQGKIPGNGRWEAKILR